MHYIRCSVSVRPFLCLPISGCLHAVSYGRRGIGRNLNGGHDPWGSPFPLEGVHDFTSVWRGDSIERGKSSGDSVSDQESEDTNHGQSSIVLWLLEVRKINIRWIYLDQNCRSRVPNYTYDFNQQASFTLFIAHFLVELEGIVKIRDPVD